MNRRRQYTFGKSERTDAAGFPIDEICLKKSSARSLQTSQSSSLFLAMNGNGAAGDEFFDWLLLELDGGSDGDGAAVESALARLLNLETPMAEPTPAKKHKDGRSKNDMF
jgi:hypothetical protein